MEKYPYIIHLNETGITFQGKNRFANVIARVS